MNLYKSLILLYKKVEDIKLELPLDNYNGNSNLDSDFCSIFFLNYIE